MKPDKLLLARDKDALLSLAIRQIEETEPSKAIDKAYGPAARIMAKHMKGRFPPADMLVLKKYDLTQVDRCQYYTNGAGGYQQFTFRDTDDVPLIVVSRYCNSRNPYLLTEAEFETVDAYNKAREAFKKSIGARFDDLSALIKSSKKFNELAAVWGGAEELRDKIVTTGTALVTLSEEVIERIKNDPASKKGAR